MGKQSRAKRERKEGTALENSPSGGAEKPSRRRLYLLIAAAAAALVLVAGVTVACVLLFSSSSGSKSLATLDKETKATLAAAGCKLRVLPEIPYQSITSYKGTTAPKYNSMPPTSGVVGALGVVWDLYEVPVPQAGILVNLSKGGVAVQYGDRVPKPTVDKLKAFWNEDTNGMLLAPFPQLGDKIALTAWTRLATCTKFDDTAFHAFRSAYRYKMGLDAEYYKKGTGGNSQLNRGRSG